ncbi:MAG: serpin family protein [Bacteroidetes bacterium]|nr:serpin family protein [Bacteroidota bacterium]MBT4402142.1 serpin family protein [Bacteroidota bacterium]MBT7465654.1 serpin family protein [Bacteroidota bacterium]
MTKMKYFSITIIALLFITFVSCNKDDVGEPKPLNLPLKSQELIESDNAFGINLFRTVLANEEAEKNIMISPLSVSLALSMTYNGAEGETKLAMEQVMEMTGLSLEDINQLNKQLVDALLVHDPQVILEIANSIWYRNDFTILPDFISRNENYYNAAVRALDFSDPATIDVINDWVSEKTHEKIDKIVEQITPDSFMFLINAIYFKGAWRYEFDKKATVDGPFFLNGEQSVEVPMMKMEVDANMLQNDLFTALELPYGKGNWSMFLFVPNYDKEIKDVVESFTTQNWNVWMNGFTEMKDVSVNLPKFKFAYEISLKEALMGMGMEVAFTNAADFSGILEGGQLLINDVKHKTFIEVDEEGTEAAAVTSVEINLTSIGNYFSANKPFLYAIAEKSSGTILFVGRVMNPAVE